MLLTRPLSNRSLLPLLCLLGGLAPAALAQVCAIPGAAGPATVSGVVNTYYEGVDGSVAAGSTSIPIGPMNVLTGDTTPVAVGDLVLIIQMQDADIDTSNTDSYGDGVAGGVAAGAQALNSTGRHEYCVAQAAVAAGSLAVRCGGAGGGLQYTYRQQPAVLNSALRRSYQVVRVPQYSSATVTGTVIASRWNGRTGGVLAMDVAGNLAINGTISGAGRGFRGGGAIPGGANYPSVPGAYRSVLGDLSTGGTKGEGIAGTPRYAYEPNFNHTEDLGVAGYINGDYARGAPGNGGGGAAQHNSGGGGGGNGGAGGNGGNEYNGDDPNLLGAVRGGFGGDDFSSTAAATYLGSSLLGRVVMGGGGGAGDFNDGDPSGSWSSGGPGGAIVLLRVGSLSGSGSIVVDGADGRSSDPAVSADAGGGGGAGGSVVLLVQSGSIPVGLTISARGGRGGDNINAAPPDNETDGPGGGGGGGVVLTNAVGGTVSVAAGAAGVITGSTNPNNGTTGGASAGSAGVTAVISAADIAGAGAGAACLPQVTVTKTTSTPVRTQGVDTTATYTVTASNAASRGTAYGVSLGDDLPAPFTHDGNPVVPVYTPAACGAGPSPVSGAGADPVNFGTAGGASAASFTLPGGCSVALTFSANLNAAANGVYQNPATLSMADPTRTSGGDAVSGGNPSVQPGAALAGGGTLGGSNYPSNSSTAEDVVIGTPGVADLSLTHTVAPVSAVVGGTVTFTITVTNAGLLAATGVAVHETLPAGLAFGAATPSQGSFNAATGTWSVGGLAVGSSATLTITATVAAVASASGTLTAVAEVSASDQPDSDSTPNNNVPAEDDQASAVVTVGVANLSLTKTVAPATQAVGSNVAFTVTLANAGPAGATGVAVTDLLPSGYTLASAVPSQGSYDSGTGVWSVGAVASGASASIVITGTVRPAGTYANVAEVTDSDQLDPNSVPGNGSQAGEDDRATATPTVTSGAPPIIGIAKQALVTPVSGGVFDVTYTLALQTLAGGSIAYDVQVTDNLAAAFPAPATFVIQSPPTANGGLAGNAAFNGTSNTSLLSGTGDLANGTTATVSFAVRVTPNGSTGPFNNSATASAAGVDGGAVVTSDVSDNGAVVDANGNGNPNEAGENDPTPVSLGGAVTGRVFEDLNGNGVQDGGEAGLPNVAVQLISGGITVTVTTNTSGDFAAANVPAGTVTVDVVNNSLPAGAAITTGTDPRNVTLVDGGAASAGSFAFQRQGTLNITVFNDSNANGARDAGETGIANAQVSITESDGTVRIVTTGANGTVSTGVPAGSTLVDVQNASLPPGAALTAGTDPTTVNVAAAGTGVVTVGYQAQGTIAGRVFRDGNGNGTLDAGENGFPNVQVVLTTSTGQTLNLVTNGNGDFSQTVPAGTNIVRVTDPNGFALTTANNPQNVVVTGAATGNATAIGYAAFASVAGSVWRDLDSDRVRDGGEPGLAGWRVELLDPATLAVLRTANSDATGQYTFANVIPARTYRVRFTSPNGIVFGVGVNGESGNPQANSVVNAAARSLDITPTPGSSLTQQSLPVDPQGIAYDTLTRAALAGAVVTISGPAGFSPATHLLGGAANATQTTGADGAYQFLLLPGAPAGDYTLVLTPPATYRAPSTFLPPAGTLDPTGQGVGGVLRVQGQSTPPTGAQPTTYYLVLSLAAGDPDVVNNHIPFDPPALQGGAIRLTKRADRPTVSVGGIVAYTITLENSSAAAVPGIEVRDAPPAGFSYVEGSARLDGSASAVTVRGPRPLVFSGINLNAGQRRTLRYVLRVSAGVVRGDYANTAAPFFTGLAVGNADTARVTVVADPAFEETTIVGKVFDDQNGDGWQDEGEKGIPGVRLATVEGLTVQTDAFGRYHFAAIDGGFMERGRNFIVKLDPASLPPGAKLTTENPRVARITPGLMSRFDFGVKLEKLSVPPKRIDLKLAEVYFGRDGSEVLPEYLPLLTELAERVKAGEKAKILIRVTPASPEGCTPACQRGRRRVDAVRAVMKRLLGEDGLRNVEIVADYTGAGGFTRNDGGPADWLRRAAFAALALIAPAAQAGSCPANVCETQPVEIRGVYARSLGDDWKFWATEDSTAVEPRLALEGPDRLPVRQGRIDGPASFALYTNYSSFVDEYQVVVYRGSDADRSRPLATLSARFLPRTLRTLLVVRWDAAGVDVGRERSLQYLVRAVGAKGGVDETALRSLQLLERREFDAQAQRARAASGALADAAGAAGEATDVAATPLKGRFLVLRPGAPALRLLPQALLFDPATRLATEASGGIAVAEAAIGAGQPAEAAGLEASLPKRFTRKSLLVDLEGLDDATLQVLYGRNDLARRGIAVHGGLVRMAGQRVTPTTAVRLNGQLVPVDADGQLAAESILPIGQHDLFLDVMPESGDVWPVPVTVDVTGRQLFMVGLADITWQKNDLSGSIEPLSADDRYLESSLTEGRLALFLKGKIRGKYLITTQLDSHEEQLDRIVDNIDTKDPRRLFRHIDPDQYYPVYGDDSTTLAEADTQGRLFVKVEWDNSKAVLGNFNTNFTGSEFSQYNRSLYGANLGWHGLAATRDGDAKSNLSAFASQAQTALGHDEFLGTGGSLYYLRHTDVVQGSAKARVQVIDAVTDRTVDDVALAQGVDYEIDELQGRIILAKPLLQVARQRSPQLVRQSALDGHRVLLVMDYEYLPLGFADSAASFGARGRQWLGNHVAIGGTWVSESRDTQDYQLRGADVTLQVARGSYLKLEYAQTEATQSVRYYSADGGLSFTALNPLATQALADDRSGEAMGAEARMNLRERGWTSRDFAVAAWWKRNDDQFAVSRRDEGYAVEKTGLEASGKVSDTIDVALRATSITRDGFRPGESADLDQIEAQGDWAITARDTVGAEVQYQRQQSPATPQQQATTAALAYRRALSSAWDAYAIAQTVVSESAGGSGNDLYTLGTRYQIGERWSADAEVSSGDSGDGLSGSLEYRSSERHTLYGTFSHSVDRNDTQLPAIGGTGLQGVGTRGNFYDHPGNNLALGSRWQLSDQTRIFNESQFSDSAEQAGIGHVFGLDFSPRKGWRLGATLQRGDFAVQGGSVQRNAASVSATYGGPRLNWSSRLEFRDDSGVSEATQYLATNRVDFRLRDAWRLLGKLNFSQTSQDVARLNDGRLLFGQAATDAQFAEASVGIAYRPTDSDRLNWLAKLTYLYDLSSYAQVSSDAAGEGVLSLEQSGRTDQKSLVASWDGVYRLTRRFDLGGKLAHRMGQVRVDRASGDWVESSASFAALRLSYEIISKWDAMVEYRWLDVPDTQSMRTGFLVSVDRELGRNFKVGVGYNFTDFSDDLTQLSYRFQGIFVNVVGKY